MDLWQSILLAIGGNTILLAVLGWLAKSFVTGMLVKDARKFEADLKASGDAATKKLEHQLQLIAAEHQIRFSKFHEKQADVIAEAYRLLIQAYWSASSFASLTEWNGEPNKATKYAVALKQITELYRFFDLHRIYLPPEICQTLDDLITKMRGKVIDYGEFVNESEEELKTYYNDQKKAWREAWKYFDKEVPVARQSLEIALRKLLSGQQLPN